MPLKSSRGIASAAQEEAQPDSADRRICIDCALPIAWHDLAARPQAHTCARCESERQRHRARPSGATP